MLIKEIIDNNIIFEIDIYGITDDDIMREDLSMEGGEFEEFLFNIELAFDTYGFELIKKEHSNRQDSKSLYYYFKKVENNNIVTAIVKLRISDHTLPDRIYGNTKITGTQNAKKHFSNFVKDVLKDYNQTKGYKKRLIDIVLNGIRCASYEDALTKIETTLNDLSRF